MSNDWKKQLVELSKNEEFQKKQAEIAEKFKGDEATMKEEITKLLEKYGIVEPEEGFKAPVKELSDDELGAVAGGVTYCCACPFVGVGTEGGLTCACALGGGGEANNGDCQCACVLGGGGEITLP